MNHDLPRFLRRDEPYYEAPCPRFWLAAPALALCCVLGLLYMARIACVDAMPGERERCIASAETMANAAAGDKIGVLLKELGASE